MDYPKFHPEIIRSNFNYEINAYFGIIKCKMLPPSNLFHPVLPLKINSKLFFTLCYTCAKTSNLLLCNHSYEEKYLIGAWGTPELYTAVENGYKIIKIYQVWHFKDRFQYIDENQSGLFGSYINKWMSKKMLYSFIIIFHKKKLFFF